MHQRDIDTVFQTILDEAGGNLSLALRMASARLVAEYHLAETLSLEIEQWKRGASLAYLRAQKAKGPFPPIDVPARPIVDPQPDA